MKFFTRLETWLYDHLPIGVAVLDADLVYRYTNAAYSATQGYASQQLLDTLFCKGQPDWVEALTTMTAQARETGRPVESFDVALTYPRQPGLTRSWDVTVLPLYFEDELDGFVVYLVDVTSRQQAEELSVSESLLRSVLEVAADAILVIDQEGNILQTNLATSRVFGYSADELIGKPVTTIMPESYAADHGHFMSRYMHTGVPHIIGTIREVQGKRRNGELFPCELSIAESSDSGSRRIFVGIIRDISERKQVEEQLRKLSRAVEQSPTIVMITDTDGHIEYVNPKFTEVTGYPAAEVLGQTPSFLSSGETSHEEYDRLWAMIRAGGEWRGEFHNRKKNGELYWESAAISAIRAPGGEIMRYLAVKEDITERKRLQAELEAARARLEAILNTVPLPLIVINTEEQCTLSNAAAQQFYGESLSGSNMFNLTRLHPETRTRVSVEEWPITRALREGRNISNVEQIIVFPDGTEVPVLVHAAPVVVDGHIVGAIGVAQDLTELKAADRAKDAFLALISHELKSPLTAIISWADLALEDETLRQEALEVVLRNARTQQRIIGDLLDVSRVLYGKMALEKEHVDGWEVAQRAAESQRAAIEQRQLTLRLEPPSEPLPIVADPVRLAQVFNNLLTNAMKFTPAGGTITLSGDREGEMARLSVRDTGHGIPPTQLPLIFQRFQQIGRERISGGLGLGLAVVRGLVELHGGTVEAQSDGVDKGSTFTVRLPLATSTESREAPGTA